MTVAAARVLVCVGGGIAAYKTVELVRELQRCGAEVRVAMSPAATRFVGPLTFAGITGHRVVTELWDPAYPGEVHVELSEWAEAIVIAPASANMLARMAAGMADDIVLATVCCAQGPVLVAPAMHSRMWEQPATQANVSRLKEFGTHFVGPVEGPLASGDVGAGRMTEPTAIAEAISALLSSHDLMGRHILVTAGPTHEDVDPVRFVGNRSSGRMGFALAKRARARGAQVTLVCGPTSLPPPSEVHAIQVRSAQEMQAAVRAHSERSDAVIMAAAVADYRPEQRHASKRPKGSATWQLQLVANPDILAELGAKRMGQRPMLVGFALETDNLRERARGKLESKRVDLIVANPADKALEKSDNQALLVDHEGIEELPRMPKAELADRILERVAAFLSSAG